MAADSDAFEEYFNGMSEEETDRSFDFLAGFCRKYYLSLTNYGFTEQQAMVLTVAYQRAMIDLVR